ncbi:helix-turn-helix transcriptional regulator [Nocardia sp. CDC153]|uniref:helix-turn-helix domain-containing protein n=1 Tax=Nocardia sp. CDC153 TaxID=3112167 RepID=UPI002DBF04B6|nr:helix-turn-helix transcriptional regulator [Nocardia sp. CDC153]MEC3956136.1 helix-turn-helix transcriptional regulator [Nocardia sp. CDC153]
MAVREDLAEFLKSRRARIDPQESGLPPSGLRRVPGLRRSELAHLAGISAEYYQRLEQRRAANPSAEVLDSLASALRLNPVETAHLHLLAHPPRTVETAAPTPRPELLRMLDLIDKAPAVVITDLFDVLAANPLAHYVFGAMADKNMARALFFDPAAREFYGDWDAVAAATVAQLRRVAGRYPNDPATTALIDELATGSTEFATLWRTGDVEIRTHGGKLIHHPHSGDLSFSYENLELPGDPRQRIVTFTPDPDTTLPAL